MATRRTTRTTGTTGGADAKARRVEDTAVSVVRALRRAIDAGGFAADDAVNVALVTLTRTTPGAKLSREKRADLKRALHELAKAIDPPQPRTVLAYARAAAAAAWSLLPEGRHPGAGIADRAAEIPTRELARAALYAEAPFMSLSTSGDPDEHVRRAVTRALREKRRSHGHKRVPLDDGDPLRVVLDVPARGPARLPKNDIRMRIAEASNNTLFGQALRQAARFSEELLRPVLGEDIWAIGRPVGFSDKKETRVLVEVKSALLAHEMQLRSQELVHRLQAVKGFEGVVGVKLVVVEPRALPIVGG